MGDNEVIPIFKMLCSRSVLLSATCYNGNSLEKYIYRFENHHTVTLAYGQGYKQLCNNSICLLQSLGRYSHVCKT